MANNTGTLITAPIRPQSDQDTFPTAYASEIKGGHRSVATLADLNAIAEDRKEAGMSCFVSETNITYTLIGSQWVDLLTMRLPDLSSKQDKLSLGTAGQFLSHDLTWKKIQYQDIENKPALFSGNYEDLSNKPPAYTLALKLQTLVDSNVWSDSLVVGGAITFSTTGIYDLGSSTGRFKKAWGLETDVSSAYSSRVFTNYLRSRGNGIILENVSAVRLGILFDTGNLLLGTSTVDAGHRLQVGGTTQLGGSVELDASNTYDLATGSVRFRHGYFNQNLYTGALYSGVVRAANASNGLAVVSAGGTRQVFFVDNGNVIIGNSTADTGFKLTVLGSAQINGDIIPDTTAAYNIGTAALRYNQLYISDRIVSSQVYAQIFRSGNSTGFTFYNVSSSRLMTMFDGGNILIGAGSVDNGYKLTVEGPINVGGTTLAGRFQINSANLTLATSTYSTAFVPSLNFELANVATDATAYENAMVVRGRFNPNDTIPKRISYLLKLSSEGSESKKMGGMMLESLNTYANSPNLFFLTDNEKRVQILSGGNTRFYGGQFSAANALTYVEVTSNDVQYARSDGASYLTQLSNQSLVIRVMNGATSVNQINLTPSGTAVFSGAVQSPSWRLFNTSGSTIRNSTNTATNTTFFDNGNVRIGSSTLDDGNRLQLEGSLALGGDIVYSVNNTYNIGTASVRPATIFTNVLTAASVSGSTISSSGNMGANGYVRVGTILGVGVFDFSTVPASAQAEIRSTTKGFLLPRMTMANRDAIANPAESLLVYQTDSTPGFYYYTGSTWAALAGSGGGGGNSFSVIQTTGSNLTFKNGSGTNLFTVFENGNIRFSSDTVDTGFKVQFDGSARFTGTTTIQDFSGNGYISLAGVAITKYSNQNVRIAGATEVAGGLMVGALTNNTNINASAILQADSITKGFLPPRMTSTDRLAISNPATGLVVYQTDAPEGLYVKNASSWTRLAAAA